MSVISSCVIEYSVPRDSTSMISAQSDEIRSQYSRSRGRREDSKRVTCRVTSSRRNPQTDANAGEEWQKQGRRNSSYLQEFARIRKRMQTVAKGNRGLPASQPHRFCPNYWRCRRSRREMISADPDPAPEAKTGRLSHALLPPVTA